MAFELFTAQNGVKYYRSSILASKHGFSTRIGGVSNSPHTASLNLAFGRGDTDETVFSNLALFAEAVGVDEKSIISRPQIHSAKVLKAEGRNCGEGYFVSTDEGCDGYVTAFPGVTLGVKTADCVPILFEDTDAHVIGAAHAGWRGTVSNIVGECVSSMVRLGAEPHRIRAAVGAAIHSCCYCVGEDFLDSAAKIAGDDVANAFIKPRDGRLYSDIVGINRRFMLESGILPESIDVCSLCTCCHPELFYSHRYSKGQRGTMLSIIAL